MKVYKIRHRVSGRWCKGGIYVDAEGTNRYWTDREADAKIWTALGRLRSFITSHLPKYTWRPGTNMTDWEVVEFELVAQKTDPVYNVVDPKKLLAALKQ